MGWRGIILLAVALGCPSSGGSSGESGAIRVVCIGDSNTQLAAFNSYCDLSRFETVNLGRGGSTALSWDAPGVFGNSVWRAHENGGNFDVCSSMLGSNDVTLGHTTAAYGAAIGSLIDKCLAIGIAVVIVHGPLGHQTSLVFDDLLREYREEAARVAQSYRRPAISFGLPMNTLNRLGAFPDWLPDGWHMGPGSQEVVSTLWDAQLALVYDRFGS